MTEKLDTAVILAAGLGQRLEEAGRDLPKGFLRIGTLPIVEESIRKLEEAGIPRVVIVTGFLSNFYEDLAARHSNAVTLVHNPLFSESGSMYSLSLAGGRLEGGFLLLESDLVYERRAIHEILSEPAADAILVSDPTGAGDEVHVEASPDGFLRAMSKDRSRLGPNVVGELVGISKLSKEGFLAMMSHSERVFRTTRHLDYEDALVAAAECVPVRCRLVRGLAWSEIDDAAHLSRVRRVVYPEIAAREGRARSKAGP